MCECVLAAIGSVDVQTLSMQLLVVGIGRVEFLHFCLVLLHLLIVDLLVLLLCVCVCVCVFV